MRLPSGAAVGANARREIADKWEEARTWSNDRGKRKKYGMDARTGGRGAEESMQQGRIHQLRTGQLPRRTVPEMDRERGHGGVRTVPVQDAPGRY